MVMRDMRAPEAPPYRAGEVRTIAGWIASGVSGSVVGLPGCGRSNLLQHLCAQPEALRPFLPPGAGPVCLAPVDPYDLPSNTLADLYRAVLHAFAWVRGSLAPPLAERAAALYEAHRAVLDPFQTQRALYELMLAFQEQGARAVLVINRFDRFCEAGAPQMVNTLRGLRDRFKGTLSYIMGMRQEVDALPEPSMLGDMYELLDSHVCYVGAMEPADSRHMLAGVLRAAPAPAEEEVAAMLRLSGGFPSLVKAVGHWWALSPDRPASPERWLAPLLANPSVQYRLDRLWHGLTQEEKLALAEVLRPPAGRRGADASPLARRLAAKGCCAHEGGAWRVRGELLAAHVARRADTVRGRIWIDEDARVIYQGEQPVEDLTPLEYNILRFLIAHPRRRHTSDAIIEGAWPPEENKGSISPNNLQVHISSIRKKIEPNPTAPRFLLTWNGRPGGYQLVPEGKPE
jgi:DNA-binding winged helix-turn-helix (wHTH) protein